MKDFIKYGFLSIIFATSVYFAYTLYASLKLTPSSEEIKFASLTFIAGFTFAILVSELTINKLQKVITTYKRELEKEAIDGVESSSKVKVLESKIAVLEKALDDSLNK